MKRLLLIRHGETNWNVEARLQGQREQTLNATGQAQVEALAQALRDVSIDIIYSSDLERALATAQAINTAHHLPIATEKRLREFSLGKFEGLTPDELRQRYPQDFEAWRADRSRATHGGETVAQVAARVETLLVEIERSLAKTVVVVGHGGPLRVMICKALRLPEAKYWRFRLDNAGIAELEHGQNHWLLIRHNDMAHLSEIRTE